MDSIEEVLVHAIHYAGSTVIRVRSWSFRSLIPRNRNSFRIEIGHVIAYRIDLPPPGDLAELGVNQAGREQIRNSLGEARVAALGLGADGVEVNEPRPEERMRHRPQRLAHLPVQLDLVVQRAEGPRNRSLFRDWRKQDYGFTKDPEVCVGHPSLNRPI